MEGNINSIYDYTALKYIQGISDVSIANIIAKRGTLEGIFNESPAFFYNTGINEKIVNKILSKSFNEQAVENEIKLAEKHNFKLITFEDEDYPELLKEIYSPPSSFYIYGNKDCLKNVCVGIIGSRYCSKQSENFTFKLAKELAAVGITVVSGFAYGIDISAHIGAMEKGATACVLGSGLLNIYPERHTKYIDKIIEMGGCIISEFLLTEPPLPNNFPRRNRIISGLSKAIAVIEAGHRSGSLITARIALEQNRDIFAVPAFPAGKNTATNKLLRDGAKILETSLDIIEDLKYDLKNILADENNKSVKNNLTDIIFENDMESKIYEVLLIEPLSLNEICEKIKADISSVLSTISVMEINGILEKGLDEKYIII